MGFLDNSGDIILDAVLTDTGRFRLAKGDGSFKISKFALCDDEIDYSLYNKDHANGSAYYDLEILQTPILEAFTNNKISVGEPYYNSTVIPIIMPAILVMGIGPILDWKYENKIMTLKKIFPCILLTTIFTLVIFFIYRTNSLLGVLGIILGIWIIFNNSLIFKNKTKYYSKGMIISHIGVGILILGITASSTWQEEKITKMKVNDEIKIKNYIIFLKNMSEIKGKNYVALQGNFTVYDKNKNIITELKPENRFYPVTNNFTTEASIHSTVVRDLYIVLGEGNLKDGWVVRIYYNPLVMWIWVGAFIIFLGGLLTTYLNLKKLKNI